MPEKSIIGEFDEVFSMKPWLGNEFEYMGCIIRRCKDGYIYVYDKQGNQIKRIWNVNHGSLTDAKREIEMHIVKQRLEVSR